jgi:hypothetical protein
VQVSPQATTEVGDLYTNDLMNDEANCGTCANQCGKGSTCSNGACGPVCSGHGALAGGLCNCVPGYTGAACETPVALDCGANGTNVNGTCVCQPGYAGSHCQIRLNNTWAVSAFGTCSVACGGGIRSRSIRCMNPAGQVVEDALCPDPRPATAEACNTHACPAPEWMAGQWSACGGGVQTRTVSCVDMGGALYPDASCAAPRPATQQACVGEN